MDGSEVEDLVLGQADPRGIAIDAVARKLYWCDPAAGTSEWGLLLMVLLFLTTGAIAVHRMHP